MATGDSDLNFEIKFDDGLLHRVGMSRNPWEAQSLLCMSSLANIFQKGCSQTHMFDVQGFYSCSLKLCYVLNQRSSVSKDRTVAWDLKKKNLTVPQPAL